MHFCSLRCITWKGLAVLALTTGLWAPGYIRADDAPASSGNVIFDSDFSKGSLDHLGWRAKDVPWQEFDYGASKANLENNPGMVARFAAEKDEKVVGTLTRKFQLQTEPANLKLTFDAGWGWGAAGQASDSLQIEILDDDGNGYAFGIHRTKATWAAQWAVVNKYVVDKWNWAPEEIDATQQAIVDGGGLQSFTITRDANGGWTLSGAKWTGGTPLAFSDSTTKSFSQVVLVGGQNVDDQVFNKIKLEVTPKS